VTFTVALADVPPWSVTVAVSVCVPAVRLVTVIEAPVPRAPLRLDVQRIAALRLPSSKSVRWPLSSAGWPRGARRRCWAT
jgi:hypothetical protein